MMPAPPLLDHACSARDSIASAPSRRLVAMAQGASAASSSAVPSVMARVLGSPRLLFHVASFLDMVDVCRAGCVCKRWRELCTGDDMWALLSPLPARELVAQLSDVGVNDTADHRLSLRDRCLIVAARAQVKWQSIAPRWVASRSALISLHDATAVGGSVSNLQCAFPFGTVHVLYSLRRTDLERNTLAAMYWRARRRCLSLRDATVFPKVVAARRHELPGAKCEALLEGLPPNTRVYFVAILHTPTGVYVCTENGFPVCVGRAPAVESDRVARFYLQMTAPPPPGRARIPKQARRYLPAAGAGAGAAGAGAAGSARVSPVPRVDVDDGRKHWTGRVPYTLEDDLVDKSVLSFVTRSLTANRAPRVVLLSVSDAGDCAYMYVDPTLATSDVNGGWTLGTVAVHWIRSLLDARAAAVKVARAVYGAHIKHALVGAPETIFVPNMRAITRPVWVATDDAGVESAVVATVESASSLEFQGQALDALLRAGGTSVRLSRRTWFTGNMRVMAVRCRRVHAMDSGLLAPSTDPHTQHPLLPPSCPFIDAPIPESVVQALTAWLHGADELCIHLVESMSIGHVECLVGMAQALDLQRLVDALAATTAT